MGDDFLPDAPGRSKLFVKVGDKWVDVSGHVVGGFNFDTENGEEMSIKSSNVSVRVADLFEVYPELAQCGESHSEFAQKIARAAEWNRGLDADTDLYSRLFPDEVDEVAEKRNEKEDS